MRKVMLIFICFLIGIPLFSAAMAQEKPKFEQPILISSAGQSADVKLVGMLAKRQKLNAKAINMAKVSDLKGIKTLIIVPGFSSKGLGAAGVSQKEEMARVTALVKAAHEKKIPIILMHVGGNARRKGQSDAFNQLVAENSKHMIVVEQGNTDGFFTKIAKEKNIPIELAKKIAKTAVPMGNLFK